MKDNISSVRFLLILIFFWQSFLAQKPLKVACVGNSITYGYGIGDREKDSYPAVLQSMLGKNYIVGNFGKSGATLLKRGHRPYIEQEEYKKAIEFAGDIVIIHLGVNDTDPRNWPNYRDHFVQDYLDLMESFLKANPKTRIIIANISPILNTHPRFESGTRDWHTEIRKAIETVAKISENQLIDFFEPLRPYPQLLPDGIHPNEKGAKILAQTVYSAITGNYGGLQLSQMYTDNMVLQHGIPLVIRGKANAKDKITVKIGKDKKTAITDLNGNWKVTLNPLITKYIYILSITNGKQKKEFKNVAAGEVWLCSGQSNMEFYLKNSSTGKEDIPLSANKNIRFFDMKARWRTDNVEWSESVMDSLNNLQYYTPAKWEVSTPETSANFSAVAYYFGKILQDSLDIPIGLICNAIGGSSTESWIDRSTLEHRLPKILDNWKENDFIQDWVRSRASKNIQKSTIKFQRHPYEPTYLFDSGIVTLDKFPIKGVIWYQGESNAHNKDAHSILFKALVESWRNYWDNAEMPFYFVQLSSINRPSWAWFRDSQRRLLAEMDNVGMIVSSDCGDFKDVHPTKKRPLGERLAYLALNKTYHKTNVIPSGPMFKSVSFSNGKALVSFDYADGLKTSDGNEIRTFEIAEYKGLYYPAKAEIIDNQIHLQSEKVRNPKYVRYGWKPFTDANLVNRANLPASTFTSE